MSAGHIIYLLKEGFVRAEDAEVGGEMLSEGGTLTITSSPLGRGWPCDYSAPQ